MGTSTSSSSLDRVIWGTGIEMVIDPVLSSVMDILGGLGGLTSNVGMIGGGLEVAAGYWVGEVVDSSRPERAKDFEAGPAPSGSDSLSSDSSSSSDAELSNC